MNKKVLALAVAAVVFGAPVVASANATLSGVIVTQVRSIDGDVGSTHRGEIIVSGSEDLGNGLSGLFRVGVQTENGKVGVERSNEQFVGLRGAFGTALIGRLDHPYRTAGNTFRIFGDTVGTVGTSGAGGSVGQASLQREQNDGAIAWVSPNLSGLTLSGAVVPSSVAGSNKLPYSLRAAYTAGPVFLTAAYEDLEDLPGKRKAWLVGGRYSAGGLTVGVMYEDVDGLASRVLAPVTYTMGSLVLRASVMLTDPDAGSKATDYALGMQYNLSSRTNVRVTAATQDDNDTNNFGITVAHSF
jgi:predicted porin